MAWTLSNEEYNELKNYREETKTLRETLQAVGLLVTAAARCGFKCLDQEDALLFALERITKEPRAVVRLLIDATPKGYHGRDTH